MDTNTLLIAIASASIISIIWFVILYTYKQAKDRRQIARETKAELTYMREYLETKLYDLDHRLMRDRKRWEDVNHLILDSQRKMDFNLAKQESIPISTDFLKNMEIDINKYPVRKDLVFLLTPFHKEFRPVFEKLSLACSKLGLKLIRGDEEFISVNILRHIIQNILQSRIVIANLDGRNPNVFYELGIAQAIGKTTILITQNLEEVPFDLQSKYLIIYKTLSELGFKLNKTFTQLMINE